ncbi:hypothetical protein ACFX12_029803 [Malus domestica]
MKRAKKHLDIFMVNNKACQDIRTTTTTTAAAAAAEKMYFHSGAHLASQIRQVVQFDGGGEKNGIDGILEIEGIVVGKVGSAGKGGSVTFGIVGIVGNAGCEGNGGNVALGSVGTEGIGGNVGNVGFGRDGIVGTVKAGGGAPGVAKRFRAARLKWVLESDNTMDKDKMKKSLVKAMIESLKCFFLFPFGYTF